LDGDKHAGVGRSVIRWDDLRLVCSEVVGWAGERFG
jgi:hypothetical protein